MVGQDRRAPTPGSSYSKNITKWLLYAVKQTNQTPGLNAWGWIFLNLLWKRRISHPLSGTDECQSQVQPCVLQAFSLSLRLCLFFPSLVSQDSAQIQERDGKPHESNTHSLCNVFCQRHKPEVSLLAGDPPPLCIPGQSATSQNTTFPNLEHWWLAKCGRCELLSVEDADQGHPHMSCCWGGCST